MEGAASRETAMEEAFALVEQGKTEALRRLIVRRRVDLNAFLKPDDPPYSWTLLYHAVKHQRHEILTLLLELGAHVDVGVKETGRSPLHSAVLDDDERAVSLLLAHGANVNAVSRTCTTPLCFARSAQVAQLLVDKGAVLHYFDTGGYSVLFRPVVGKHWDVVELLLRHGLDINHVTKDGENALHVVAPDALSSGDVKTLLDMGAEINGRDAHGQTPLHKAVEQMRPNGAESLLAAGADINASDKNGRRVIHVVLHEIRSRGINSQRIRCLQVLVSHGAKWDEKCEKWLANIPSKGSPWGKRQSILHDGAQAICLCIQHWMEEYHNGLPSTEIPEEDIKRGSRATKTYLNQLAKSTHVVYRRKICVVGPSNWGKTSLVKSLVSQKPSLVHPDDRTIGIDKFKLAFDQSMPGPRSRVHHEVTFWDFAGQDEYQVAHSLFFSRRTLYLVCIDLSAYTTAYYKAEMITGGDPMALSERMNAFVEAGILRWIRLILARQPDAEFQFIGTKNDLTQVVDADPLTDLKSRLANVLVIVGGISRGDKGSVTHLGDTRLARMTGERAVEMTLVSCTQLKSVAAALSEIKSLICKSDRSYVMPDSYSAVLRMIKKKRKAAQDATMCRRVAECFVKVDELTGELAQNLKKISRSTSCVILQALRDLGDVLWYEDVDDLTLRDTVILDPLLLIDLVRKIFNHKQKSEVLCHADLHQLDVWKDISRDVKLMLAMKRLLQKFHLAYPAGNHNEMQWHSDLLLPASWRTKTSAQLMFMGQPLNHPYGVTEPREWLVDVHWEIAIESGFEEALFDRLVVATYDPAFLDRRVGPDYILYGDATSPDPQYACRLVVDWHRVTHKRVLHLEAVLFDESARALWARFERLCEGLAVVFAMFPGLRGFVSARIGIERPNITTCTTPMEKWLPPEPTLSKCRGFLTFARAAVEVPLFEDEVTWADPLRKIRAKWRQRRRERHQHRA